MKHALKITCILLILFILSQIIGLVIISEYIDIQTTSQTGNTTINYEKYVITPPEVENESNSWYLLLIPIIIGTLIVLLIIKYKLFLIWKVWFFLSITLALFIAIHPFTSKIIDSFIFSAVIAVVLGFAKLRYPNPIIHNFTEILLYGGIAALFVPVLNVTSAIIVLILIAIYDIIAVWFSKHMVSMAQFQTSQHAFAGIHIPGKITQTQINPSKKTKRINKKQTTAQDAGAILGGGDIAFPLLFAGVILKTTGSFYLAGIISLFALFALAFLLTISKKGKFYPAMPFISTGCLLGYGVILLL